MRCRYAHFYCGFFLELKGEHTQAAPFLEAAAAQPSGDYMGKLMPLISQIACRIEKHSR